MAPIRIRNIKTIRSDVIMGPLQAAVTNSWSIDEGSHVLDVLSNQAIKEVDVGVTEIAKIEIFIDVLRRSL